MVMYNKSEEDVNCMKSTTFLCAASTCNDTHIYHHYIINAKFTICSCNTLFRIVYDMQFEAEAK